MSAAARQPVGLVLAGGGARGAYEVGALSVLLPALEAEGMTPRVLAGTSVGALNTAFVAANLGGDMKELIARATRIYTSLEWGHVMAPLVSVSEASLGVRYLLGALGGLRGIRVPGLLDPSPLSHTLARVIGDFGAIGRNVRDGVIDSAAVVATSALTSRSVVFHSGGKPRAARDDRRGIDYAAVSLTAQHVRASAAIPAVFPAVHVDPEPGRGWYFDGGTRLNTPIKPVLWLGARRVVAIGLNSVAPAGGSAGRSAPLAGEARPDLFAGAGQLFVALLAAPLAHDIQTLATINELVGGRAATRLGRRQVPYVFVAPERADSIGALAAEVFARRYRRGFGLRAGSPELALLGRLVEGDFDAAHGELLSYLFFDGEFCSELIGLGRADAQRWLDAAHDDGLWQLGPLAAPGAGGARAAGRRAAGTTVAGSK
jgi:NTE family protein